MLTTGNYSYLTYHVKCFAYRWKYKKYKLTYFNNKLLLRGIDWPGSWAHWPRPRVQGQGPGPYIYIFPIGCSLLAVSSVLFRIYIVYQSYCPGYYPFLGWVACQPSRRLPIVCSTVRQVHTQCRMCVQQSSYQISKCIFTTHIYIYITIYSYISTIFIHMHMYMYICIILVVIFLVCVQTEGVKYCEILLKIDQELTNNVKNIFFSKGACRKF